MISKQMKNTFGFEQAYADDIGNKHSYAANMDTQQPVNIQGYDMLVNTNSYRGTTRASQQPPVDFEVRGVKYKLILDRLSPQEVRVSVRNAAGIELVGTGLYDFATSRSGGGNSTSTTLFS